MSTPTGLGLTTGPEHLTHRHHDGNGGRWWKKHATPTNLLLVAMFLVQAGQYWERQKASNASVAALESRLAAVERSDQTQNLEARELKGTLSAWMRAIEQRLQAIESAVNRK